jgi:hypothetical protein
MGEPSVRIGCILIQAIQNDHAPGRGTRLDITLALESRASMALKRAENPLDVLENMISKIFRAALFAFRPNEKHWNW